MSEPGSQEVHSPENIKQVNWGLDLDEGSQEAINYNLKLFQDTVGGHGIYLVEDMTYKKMVIPDKEPLLFRLKIAGEMIAIPLGDELVFTPPGKSKKATVLVLGESRTGRGICYRLFKYGEENNTFERTVVVDSEKEKEASRLGQLAVDQLVNQGKLTESWKTGELARKLATEARQHETKLYEVISPSILQGRGMQIGPGNVSIVATGIVNSLLLVKVWGPFKVQVFTHGEAK